MPCACLESPVRASATAIAGRFVRLRERARLVAAPSRACPKLPISASSRASKAATRYTSTTVFEIVFSGDLQRLRRKLTSRLQFTQIGSPRSSSNAQEIDSRQFARGPLQFTLHAGLISQSRRDPKQVEVDALVLGIVDQPGVENRPGFIGTVLCHIRNCNHIKDGELMRANPDRIVGLLLALLELPRKMAWLTARSLRGTVSRG